MHALGDLSGGGTPTLGLNDLSDLKGGPPHVSHYNGIRLIIMTYSDFHGRINPPLTRPKNGWWDSPCGQEVLRATASLPACMNFKLAEYGLDFDDSVMTR